MAVYIHSTIRSQTKKIGLFMITSKYQQAILHYNIKKHAYT